MNEIGQMVIVLSELRIAPVHFVDLVQNLRRSLFGAFLIDRRDTRSQNRLMYKRIDASIIGSFTKRFELVGEVTDGGDVLIDRAAA